MSKLILHAGANAATIEQVMESPTPERTKSHVPIAHGTLVKLVTETLQSKGLTVVDQEFGLWKDGARMFGVMTLANGNNHDDYALTVGVRNSHDRSFPAAGAIGTRVFVCDNLAFSGEVSFGRRHTANIVADLPNVVNLAMDRLIDLKGWQDKRIEAYKSCDLYESAGSARAMDRDVNDLVIRMYKAGVIPNQKISDLLDEWESPKDEASRIAFAPRTLWSLFNAATEVLKGTPAQLPKRTTRLHALCDERVGFTKITATHIGDDLRQSEVGDVEEADFEVVEN